MKFRALILALICCLAAGTAFANGIHVVFDPPSGPVPISGLGLGDLSDPSAVYIVPTEDCSSTGPSKAFGITTPGLNDACIALLNQTDTSLSQFAISFVLTQTIVTDDDPTGIICSNLEGDTHLLSNTCDPNGTFNVGDTVSAQFFATDPSQDIPNNTAIFIEIQGISSSDLTTVNVTAPEPASLTLLAAGMGLIGMCMVFAKR